MATLLTAVEASRQISKGALSAVACAESLLLRAENANSLNIFTHLDAEGLLQAARQADASRSSAQHLPLSGVPIGMKANIDVSGMPSSAGTSALRGHLPARTAPAVLALTKAGALPAGKLNMHELAFGITSNNAVFGAVGNPYDSARVAGGSSGGCAAAIAAGIIPAALGTDTGGSTRIPAALCGIAGMRPTIWRYPQDGVVPISHTRDTVGPMARNVADLACLDGLISGEPLAVKSADLTGVRIGIPAPFYDNLHPDIEQAADRVRNLLAEAGAVLIELDMSDVVALNGEVTMPICFYEILQDMPRYLAASGASCTLEDIVKGVGSPDVGAVFEVLNGEGRVSASDYYEIMAVRRPALKKACYRHFSENSLEAVFFPTTVMPAPKIGEDAETLHNGQQVPTFPTLVANTDHAGNAGLPGVSIPVGLPT